MARTPFASSISTSFSSSPGRSAVTFTSLSVSLTSTFGHASVRSKPNGARSKPRKTSSNTRFISPCKVRNGLPSSPRRTVTPRPRFHGIRSLTFIVIPPSDKGLPPPGRAARGNPVGRRSWDRLGCLLMLDLLVVGSRNAGLDLDPARLHCLRHLADQIDLQQPVLERGALHLDVVGEVKLTPKRTRGNPLIEVLVITLLGLAAFHRKHVLLRGDGDLFGHEAGKRQRDAIVLLTGSLDVVGRVVVLAPQPERIVDEVEQAIETDGRSPERG